MSFAKAQLRKIEKAIKALEKTAASGRVARRNARAKVFGAIKSLENAVEAKFPLEPKPLADDVLAKARRMTWRGFLVDVKSVMPEAWDIEKANAFYAAECDLFNVTPKPIMVVETNPAGTRFSDVAETIWTKGFGEVPSTLWREIFQRAAMANPAYWRSKERGKLIAIAESIERFKKWEKEVWGLGFRVRRQARVG